MAQIINWAWIAVMGLTGWLWRQISGKASKEELASAIERSREDMGRLFDEIKADREDRKRDLDDAAKARHAMRDNMQNIALTVARLEGKISQGGHL